MSQVPPDTMSIFSCARLDPTGLSNAAVASHQIASKAAWAKHLCKASSAKRLPRPLSCSWQVLYGTLSW